jgi:hypothetical protein
VPGADGFHVANAIERFAMGDRDDPSDDDDGSPDLYLQHDHPDRTWRRRTPRQP